LPLLLQFILFITAGHLQQTFHPNATQTAGDKRGWQGGEPVGYQTIRTLCVGSNTFQVLEIFLN